MSSSDKVGAAFVYRKGALLGRPGTVFPGNCKYVGIYCRLLIIYTANVTGINEK